MSFTVLKRLEDSVLQCVFHEQRRDAMRLIYPTKRIRLRSCTKREVDTLVLTTIAEALHALVAPSRRSIDTSTISPQPQIFSTNRVGTQRTEELSCTSFIGGHLARLRRSPSEALWKERLSFTSFTYRLCRKVSREVCPTQMRHFG